MVNLLSNLPERRARRDPRSFTSFTPRVSPSPALREVDHSLFTYGPFSREAAQDRSPWVERSGTLGNETQLGQALEGRRKAHA